MGKGAVLREGAKWYGKPTIAQQHAKSVTYMSEPRKMMQSSFVMVLTAAGNYAFKRKDGVIVFPIGCLKD